MGGRDPEFCERDRFTFDVGPEHHRPEQDG